MEMNSLEKLQNFLEWLCKKYGIPVPKLYFWPETVQTFFSRPPRASKIPSLGHARPRTQGERPTPGFHGNLGDKAPAGQASMHAMHRIHSESLNFFQSKSIIGICMGQAVSHSLHSEHLTGSR